MKVSHHIYFLCFMAPILSLISLFATQYWMMALPMLYLFGLIPLLDLTGIKFEVSNNHKAKKILYAVSIFYLFTWGLFLQMAPSIPLDILVFKSINMGISGGIIGINCAHELGHMRSKFSQRLAQILLFSVSYTHFFIEHNKGHHKNVSTPLDPASSRLNESLYAFLPRSIIYSWLSAFNIEKRRDGVLKNTVVHYALAQIVFYIFIASIHHHLLWGMLIHSAFSILLLECVNYIEHYGLLRKKGEKRYEKVTVFHSWNSDHFFSRVHIFELSRHSDHHAHANKVFYELESIESSPQMPTGYPGMILLCLIPPLWFKVMNKQISDYQKLTTTLA